MANYFESGFTMLQELAKKKLAEKKSQSSKKSEHEVFEEACEHDNKCAHRFIDASSDCD